MSSDLETKPQICGIALGANLGDRRAQLVEAKDELRSIHQGGDDTYLMSDLFESEPVDCTPGDPVFINAVLELKTHLTPRKILEFCQNLENKTGRNKSKDQQNAPRKLDLDILYYGDLILSEPDFNIPHPRITERRFVLEPLAQIRPSLILPNSSETVSEILEQFDNNEPELKKLAENW